VGFCGEESEAEVGETGGDSEDGIDAEDGPGGGWPFGAGVWVGLGLIGFA